MQTKWKGGLFTVLYGNKVIVSPKVSMRVGKWGRHMVREGVRGRWSLTGLNWRIESQATIASFIETLLNKVCSCTDLCTPSQCKDVCRHIGKFPDPSDTHTLIYAGLS